LAKAERAAELHHPAARRIPGALEWIADHCEEYAGRWVAVGPNGLVAAADTFPELESKLDSLKGVLISHVV
jgi:hypothetical protein